MYGFTVRNCDRMTLKGNAGGVVHLPFLECRWIGGVDDTFSQHLLANMRQCLLAIFKLNSGTDKNVTHTLSGIKRVQGYSRNDRHVIHPVFCR